MNNLIKPVFFYPELVEAGGQASQINITKIFSLQRRYRIQILNISQNP